MRSAFSLALVLALVPGCAALVVAPAAVLVSQSTIEDSTYVMQVRLPVNQAWASSKTTLSHLSLKPIDTDDVARKATASIDNATVTVTVEAFDLDQSKVQISAKKFGIRDGATAAMVKDKILADIEQKY